MESLSHIQMVVLGAEGALVLLGIAVWIFRTRPLDEPTPAWEVPLTDTLFLAWAVLFGAFLGQLAGLTLLRVLPDSITPSESLKVVIIGGSFHGGCLASWFAIHAFQRRKGRAYPATSQVLLGLRELMRKGVMAFLLVVPVVLTVGLIWATALRVVGLPVEQQDLVGVFMRSGSPAEIAGLLLIAVVVAPLSEELIFRAGIFRALRGSLGRWGAIAVSSSLFALLHGSWVGFAPLFCLGAVFCLAYERSRNIAVPMIAHGLFNLNSIILIVTVPPEFLQ